MIGRLVGAILLTAFGLAPASALALVPGEATQVVAATRIASLADRAARSAVTNPELALAPAFQIVDVRVPQGRVELTSGTALINPTYVSVPIAIAIDGTPALTVYAGYRITTYIRTAVAAHDLIPDAILQSDDLTYARVPYCGRPPLETTGFIGRKVRSLIARGAVVYPELTVVNLIVHAGMPALFIVHDGSVSIAADVVARTSGGLGEFVTIFNPQTQKALSGVVTGPNVVELTLPGAN